MSEDQTDPNAAAEVRQLVEEWAGAVRRNDLAGILRNHSPSILMFDVPPPLQSKGIDAYTRTWDVFFSWSHDPVVFDIAEMSVTAGREVAFVAAVMRCSGRETSGEDIELEFCMNTTRFPLSAEASLIVSPLSRLSSLEGAIRAA